MSTEQVLSILAPWKSKKFRDYELSWSRAADSLSGANPLVEVRPDKRPGRWTVYSKATGKIAIFHYAALWSWASPLRPAILCQKAKIHPREPIRLEFEWFLEASYAINTTEDPSFYDAARASAAHLAVEEHVTGLENFNKYKRPRRAWQEGETEYTRARFIMAARLLVKRTPYNSKETHLPYKLHPWLQNALEGQSPATWLPNPERPAILEYVNGQLKMLKPTHHQYFNSGDVVWFSFALSFDVNANNWAPEYKPLDFIRVGSLPVPVESSSFGDVVGGAYQSLSSGAVSLLDDSDEVSMAIDDTLGGAGEMAFVDDTAESAGHLKRTRDSDGDETMSESGLSEKSAYSAAQAALEQPQIALEQPAKRPKAGEGASSAKPPSTKANATVDEGSKKRAPAKGKGKA